MFRTRIISSSILSFFISCLTNAQTPIPKSAHDDHEGIMSERYWNFWNEAVQKEIDEGIEQNRKGDAVLAVPAGVTVKVEQVSHSFIFGANIFLFGQLGSEGENEAYKKTFTTLFNSATIPFYWKTLEPVKGKPRYEPASEDIYRRPSTDQIVDFCEQNGILPKGHAIIYGMRRWAHPTWMPDDRKAMEKEFEAHIKELASRYKDRVRIWDVVNEPLDQANRGLMPDDYVYKSFKWAMEYFPPGVQLNINDIDLTWDLTYMRRYVEIVRNLIDRGIRIDNVGAEIHLLDPIVPPMIARGDSILTPDQIKDNIRCLKEAERPVQVSEVTICSPDDTHRGKLTQAIIARNLYRLWFSLEGVTGITWWNVADGGGANGEPSYSGIYDMKMDKKPAYYALDEMINHEWKTNLTIKADRHGEVRFRGFKGEYKISWKDKKGYHSFNYTIE